MQHFLIGCTLGAAIAAAIAAPLFGPWPFRVRYLANAQTVDPLLGLGPTPRLDLRMVTVTSVALTDGRVAVEIAETGSRRETGLSLSRTAPVATVAKLEGWSTLHTPLLEIVDDDGAVHLFGPDGAVIDLIAVKEKVL
jgi:hypothetical protein